MHIKLPISTGYTLRTTSISLKHHIVFSYLKIFSLASLRKHLHIKKAQDCVLFIVLEGPRKTRYTNGIDSRLTLETSVGTDCAIPV